MVEVEKVGKRLGVVYPCHIENCLAERRKTSACVAAQGGERGLSSATIRPQRVKGCQLEFLIVCVANHAAPPPPSPPRSNLLHNLKPVRSAPVITQPAGCSELMAITIASRCVEAENPTPAPTFTFHVFF